MSGGGGLRARLSGRLGRFSLDVAFEAAAGSVTALVGPSASGKSTILRALAGLERLDGEVVVDGEVWQGGGRFLPPHRRAVGYVFQHAALLPHLTVRGNLAYAARRSGERSARVVETAARLGLSDLLDRSPDRLSGGERRRVAIARALLTRPRLLLLDEPLSGLDTAAKADLLPELARVMSGLALPVLYVSHDPEEVARLGACVLTLEAGRLRTERPADMDPLAGLGPDAVRRLARAALEAGLDGSTPPRRSHGSP